MTPTDAARASQVEAALSGRPHGICPHCGAAVFDTADENHVVIECGDKRLNGPRNVEGYYLYFCVVEQKRINGGTGGRDSLWSGPFEPKTKWYVGARPRHPLLRAPVKVSIK